MLADLSFEMFCILFSGSSHMSINMFYHAHQESKLKMQFNVNCKYNVNDNNKFVFFFFRFYERWRVQYSFNEFILNKFSHIKLVMDSIPCEMYSRNTF